MVSVSFIRARFEEVFGTGPQAIVRAPGRVNLMGEHTDYNEGCVLPVAIGRSILVAASPREDREVHLHALDFDESASFSLDCIESDTRMAWSNYQRGIAFLLQKQGFRLRGMNALITGDVPIGAGLSSSAAVEMATSYAFKVLADFEIDLVELALLCQQAENQFVGVNCGIMDQLAACLGERNHALLIDCRDLRHDLVPIPEGAKVVVADTMKRRELLDSAYNLRRQECQEGAHLLNVGSLRDVSVDDFERRKAYLPMVVRRRCRHVVHENRRVLEAAAALRRGDLIEFGWLMDRSHESLRYDYEVSCRELDVMVEAAHSVEGVYGSRMTGAGFGGCTVSLVEEGATEDFKVQVADAYETATGVKPEIYVCEVGDGVEELKGVES